MVFSSSGCVASRGSSIVMRTRNCGAPPRAAVPLAALARSTARETSAKPSAARYSGCTGARTMSANSRAAPASRDNAGGQSIISASKVSAARTRSTKPRKRPAVMARNSTLGTASANFIKWRWVRSRSTARTRRPARANAAANSRADVVLPTPPLKVVMAMIVIGLPITVVPSHTSFPPRRV